MQIKKTIYISIIFLFAAIVQLFGTEQTTNTKLKIKIPAVIDSFTYKNRILKYLKDKNDKIKINSYYTRTKTHYTIKKNLTKNEKFLINNILHKSLYYHKNEPMTHHMMILVIQLGIIIFAAKFGGMFFNKFFKMPSVLGELFTGILIGSQMLGGISLPGFEHGLFHSFGSFPISAELYGIATIASIILLFLAGLETDFDMFIRFSFAGSIVGIGGVIFSFLGGNLTAVLLSSLISKNPIGFMHPTALFLGTISTATSVGITARILSEKRKMDSPEGVSILAGAVIDDVLGIIILAIVLGISSSTGSTDNTLGPDWNKIGLIALKAIGFWLSATIIGMLIANKISSFLKNFSNSMMATMSLGLALILAGLSEMAGLAMIIGAYIMGLSLSKTDIAHLVQEKLTPLYNFFVPVFFTVMGMLVDFSSFASTNVIIFGLIFSVIAVITKILGSSLPSLFLGFNFLGAIRIGIGMVPRGEVALIIAGIGLSAGLIPPSVFGISVMMTLISTLIAPPILVKVFSINKRGTKKEVKIKGSEIKDILIEFKNAQTTNLLVENITQTFTNEEFFVHIIDMETKVYSIRKDEISVTMRHMPKKIEISCNIKDFHYIKFILSESIINLVEIIDEIKDASDLRGKPKELLTS